ncbi:MAG TPA: hypothetical protein VFE13_09585 [Caulobacteraceae bacterium]|nr:hypothetical protein [Caulobacteraceae bacterium]
MTERTTVRLPDALLRDAKRKAAEEGRTLTSLIEEGLRRVVADVRDAARPRSVNIPVSSATGWLKPPFKRLKDIEDFEDAAYVRRLSRLE